MRYATAAVTVLMSLMNLPFASTADVPAPVGWLVTVLGVLGIAAAIALLRRQGWAPWAVTAVGVLNLLGAVPAVAMDREGAVTGIVVSTVIVVLGVACLRRPAPGRPSPA